MTQLSAKTTEVLNTEFKPLLQENNMKGIVVKLLGIHDLGIRSELLNLFLTANIPFLKDLKTIPGDLFYGTYITSIKISNGITKLSNSCFFGCNELKTIDLPDTLTEIGIRSFGETSISVLKIPESVTTIREGAFTGMENLKSIFIPDSISVLEKRWFDTDSKVTIYVNSRKNLPEDQHIQVTIRDVDWFKDRLKVNGEYTVRGEDEE